MNDTDRDGEREGERLDALREQDKDRAQRRREKLLRAMHAAHRDANLAGLSGVAVQTLRGKEWHDAALPLVVNAWLSLTPKNASTLVLVGAPGLGKTYAAAALALDAVRHIDVAWWSVAGLLDALRPSRRDAAEDVWQAACSAPLLVLDDLANARASEWAAERLWILADHRTGDRLRTVVTTNATFAELEEVWGRATMDRFRDGIAVVRFAGESKRIPLW